MFQKDCTFPEIINPPCLISHTLIIARKFPYLCIGDQSLKKYSLKHADIFQYWILTFLSALYG